MGTKTFYKSKIFWVNIIAIVGWIITDSQLDSDQLVNVNVYLGYAVAGLNIALRLFGTKTNLTLT